MKSTISIVPLLLILLLLTPLIAAWDTAPDQRNRPPILAEDEIIDQRNRPSDEALEPVDKTDDVWSYYIGRVFGVARGRWSGFGTEFAEDLIDGFFTLLKNI
ncbi:uncharacterized protein H6S33_006153 [Morchella sextelata]|uniref:uncharacterized protein n=1 Tax=Morchella sextelata TaxID=1174677 RepID=UPI001D045109|nr:uncharacterized protein H6S33_006153 [Morchella sextelata]KAH0614267.1 hypothetical protein H6S33_006153 [Morchella sextelata]